MGRRRQLPGRHRPAPAAGAADARAEARVGRTARRRYRARLQQPADRDRRLQRVPRGQLRRRRPAPRGRAGDRARLRSRRGAHEPAARFQPPPGAPGGDPRSRRRRRGARETDLGASGRRRRALDLRDARLPRARRRRPDRTGDHEPRAQRPRRNARGRQGRARRELRRRRGRADRERHRCRHGCRDHHAHLRAVLHDQGCGEGHGSRPRDRLRNRQAVRRRDLRHLRAGRGVDLPHRPASLDRRRARSRSSARSARSSGTPPRACSWPRTRRRFAPSSARC